jgi:outer membrane lipoprotein-sorting protein
MINKTKILKAILISTLFLSNFSNAGDKEDGLTIAKKVENNDTGWNSSESVIKMVLLNPNGSKSIRDLKVKSLEVIDGGDKSLTIFENPSDVSGTIFLSHSMIMEPDLQWIYLPALKRVKRISSRNKSGPFMGSEFAYEDMSSFELDKFKFKLLDNEILNGVKNYILELTPTDEFSGYSKQKIWVDTDKFRIHKIEFYDKKNSLLKILEMSEYKEFKNEFWRPMLSRMKNVQTNKQTNLTIESIKFDVGLNANDFDNNRLKRMR